MRRSAGPRATARVPAPLTVLCVSVCREPPFSPGNGDDAFPAFALAGLAGVAATIGLLFVTLRWITKNRELRQSQVKTATADRPAGQTSATTP